MTAKAALIGLLAFGLSAGFAAAQETALRPNDAERLATLDAAFGPALRQALAEGAADDIAAMVKALHGVPQPDPRPEALLGEWSCRTFKLGGQPALVAYQPFSCRVSQTPQGVLFEKTTGSQRVRGLLVQDTEGLLTLAGVGYIAGDTPPGYAALPATIEPTATPQRLPSPGRVEVTGPDSARILFPFPLVESTLDILQLSR